MSLFSDARSARKSRAESNRASGKGNKGLNTSIKTSRASSPTGGKLPPAPKVSVPSKPSGARSKAQKSLAKGGSGSAEARRQDRAVGPAPDGVVLDKRKSPAAQAKELMQTPTVGGAQASKGSSGKTPGGDNWKRQRKDPKTHKFIK